VTQLELRDGEYVERAVLGMTTTKYRTGMRMSLDEFLSMGKTDGKWELDDGETLHHAFRYARPSIPDKTVLPASRRLLGRVR
jgi:hypothetical protein